MKAFRFRLQSVRQLREQKEQAAQRSYSEALRDRDSAAARLRTATRALTAWQKVIEDKLRTGLQGGELNETRAWQQVLERRCGECRKGLEEAEQLLQAAGNVMNQAARDRKAMDRHYEKSRLAHNREELRQQQKELDELGARQRGGPSELLRFARPIGAETL